MDVLTHVSSGMARAYPATYYLLVRHLSTLWGTGFELLDSAPIYARIQPLRRAWNLSFGRPFAEWLRSQAFDVVVATHFLPADLVGSCRRAGWLTSRLAVVITDLHPHQFWLAPEADAFVVASEETAAVCEHRNVPRERLHVLGIPTGRAFHLPVDRATVLRTFGLDPARQTILVTSGGTTVGPFEAVVEALGQLESRLPGRLQLLVVCGENAAAARRLQRRAHQVPMPMRVFGFTDRMADLMGVSDLVVAKAGGLTISEALTKGLPLVLYHAIPGQERFNAEFLERHGAGVLAPQPRGAAAAAARYFQEPARFDTVRQAAKALSRPTAAQDILSQVILPLARHAKA